MTAYETNTVVGSTYPQPMIRPQPQSPEALAELSGAAKAYSDAASTYLTARDALTDARERFNHCRDVFAKAAETEGV